MKDLRDIIIDNERADVVTAKTLVKRLGQKLIGRTVMTPQLGDYPGGAAVVIEIAPDPIIAPEISFTVNHPTFGECGVFEYERVRLLS